MRNWLKEYTWYRKLENLNLTFFKKSSGSSAAAEANGGTTAANQLTTQSTFNGSLHATHRHADEVAIRMEPPNGNEDHMDPSNIEERARMDSDKAQFL